MARRRCRSSPPPPIRPRAAPSSSGPPRWRTGPRRWIVHDHEARQALPRDLLERIVQLDLMPDVEERRGLVQQGTRGFCASARAIATRLLAAAQRAHGRSRASQIERSGRTDHRVVLRRRAHPAALVRRGIATPRYGEPEGDGLARPTTAGRATSRRSRAPWASEQTDFAALRRDAGETRRSVLFPAPLGPDGRGALPERRSTPSSRKRRESAYAAESARPRAEGEAAFAEDFSRALGSSKVRLTIRRLVVTETDAK